MKIDETAAKISALAETIENLAVDATCNPKGSAHLAHAIECVAREVVTLAEAIETATMKVPQ